MNKYHFFYFIVFALMISSSRGSFDSMNNSAYNVALGDPIINIYNGGFGAIHDPRSLTMIEGIKFSLTSGNKFGLKELSETSWLVGLPFQNYSLGFGVHSFGNIIYKETSISLLLSHQFKPSFKWGASLNYFQLYIKDYGSASSFGLNISWESTIANDISFIGALTNLNNPTIGMSEERLPQLVSSGLLYQFENKIKAYMSWEQDIKYRGSIKFGCSYTPSDYFGIGLGSGTYPEVYSGGFYIKYSTFKLEYGIISYENIGRYSQKVSMYYTIPHH